ncbi:MAG: hypothetical protein DDT32_02118 [Syntrophomonadaceae bacterium]|nr:hypothetical protein [Bacillota bacterium]
MAHFHIKKKKGRPYLYVREIARVNGKPKVVSQVYIGSVERVRAYATGTASVPPKEKRLKVQEFGSLFLAQLADRDIDLVQIVNSVIPPRVREKGLTIGEYFLYCVWNRMIEAVSKRSLADWYEPTAVQQIRPLDLSELTGERYWDKWDRVSEKALRQISHRFFEKVWQIDQPRGDCLLFDTTNYYTYLATPTESELAKRAKSKDGKSHLRQIGLALLVDRDSRLPLFYREYPGNIHDSRQFELLMKEMFGLVGELNPTGGFLTVVMDKGMNSESNIQWIDEQERLHFVTTYSPCFAEELASLPLYRFTSVETVKNRWLEEANKEWEQLTAYRTRGEFWGKERTVVVTYNPATARKQAYALDKKLQEVHHQLLEMSYQVRKKAVHWRNPEKIADRYHRLCEHLHLPSALYRLEFTHQGGELQMSFRSDQYQISGKQDTLGKSIIITDRSDWTTEAIVQAHLDRWQVEERFRQSKDDDLVSMRPIRHWTDSKIRCHMFSCVVALTYLRRLELKLAAAGVQRTANDAMKIMRQLHSVLSFRPGAGAPSRRLETPTKTQMELLSALGYQVDDSGVLQPLSG